MKYQGKITDPKDLVTKEYTDNASADTVKYTSQTLTDSQKTQARTNIEAGTYSKPSGGIPMSDLVSSVQTSLGKADTALQSSDITEYTLAEIDTLFDSIP